jgi:hypothetical protein
VPPLEPSGGTEGSNPVPSSGESRANSLFGGLPCQSPEDTGGEPCRREHSARLNDAGVANATDTSYIYDVLDSHPILPISRRNRAAGDERSPLNHYGLGVKSRSVAGD